MTDSHNRKGVSRRATIATLSAAPFLSASIAGAAEPDQCVAACEHWLALHADTLPPQERLVALEMLERAAGKKLDEARAALLFDMGEEPKASALWARLADRTGNRRFRNLQAAALARLPAEP